MAFLNRGLGKLSGVLRRNSRGNGIKLPGGAGQFAGRGDDLIGSNGWLRSRRRKAKRAQALWSGHRLCFSNAG